MIILPIDLQFIETKWGKILRNPLNNDLFIPNEDICKKIDRALLDMALYGDAFIEIEK